MKNKIINEDNLEEEILDDITVIESNEDGDTLEKKDQLTKMRHDLKICRKDKEEYLTGWQRAKADYVNLQKDLDSARINSMLDTKKIVLENLIPALDSFDMAFANKEMWESIDKNWRDGINSIYSQLMIGLKKSNFIKIDETGVLFDTNLHQSIKIVSTTDKKKDHTIESIIQVGYKIDNKVVRPAIVNIYELK